MNFLKADYFWSKNVKTSQKLFHICVGCLLFFTLFFIFYKSIYIASVSMILVFFYIGIVSKQLASGNDKQIVLQFNQFLYSLSSALVAGRSVENAFYELEKDLRLLYSDENTFIVREVRRINNRLINGDSLEKSLMQFSSGLDNSDIRNFAIVFSICKRTGGDLVEVIKKTASILNDKIEAQQEIEILIARKRFEAQLINLAPIAIIGLIAWTAVDYMSPLYESVIGRIVMTFSLITLFVSNLISKYIMNIKV